MFFGIQKKDFIVLLLLFNSFLNAYSPELSRKNPAKEQADTAKQKSKAKSLKLATKAKNRSSLATLFFALKNASKMKTIEYEKKSEKSMHQNKIILSWELQKKDFKKKEQDAFNQLKVSLKNFEEKKDIAFLDSVDFIFKTLDGIEHYYDVNELDAFYQKKEEQIYDLLQANARIFEEKKELIEINAKFNLLDYRDSKEALSAQFSEAEKKVLNNLDNFVIDSVRKDFFSYLLIHNEIEQFETYKNSFLNNIEPMLNNIKKIDAWRLEQFPNEFGISEKRTPIFEKIRSIRGY